MKHCPNTTTENDPPDSKNNHPPAPKNDPHVPDIDTVIIQDDLLILNLRNQIRKLMKNHKMSKESLLESQMFEIVLLELEVKIPLIIDACVTF